MFYEGSLTRQKLIIYSAYNVEMQIMQINPNCNLSVYSIKNYSGYQLQFPATILKSTYLWISLYFRLISCIVIFAFIKLIKMCFNKYGINYDLDPLLK